MLRLITLLSLSVSIGTFAARAEIAENATGVQGAQLVESDDDSDSISMSQAMTEYLPAPGKESFFNRHELNVIRALHPVQWDVTENGKPLSIPTFE